MKDYKEINTKYEFDVYPKRDVVLVKGKGAKLWDDKGNEYIDCAAGIGVANIGHANEKVAEAIYKQALTLVTCPNTFYNDTKALFLEKLMSIVPKNLNKAYLCSSGTEAMEAAIKFSRFVTKKTDFIATVKGFHGRTLGALSATYKEEYRDGFYPLVPGFSHVPFNDFEKMAEAVTDKTAGIIFEVVQGEGGINIGSKEYFQKVRKLCTEKSIILIVDEIQSGFCRTGKMFACEHFGIEPDILTLAKSIAGGFPVGVTVCSPKITLPVGKHGTTFGGNPLACAAAIASISFMLEENLAAQAEEKGNYFTGLLKKENLSKVVEIRNLGLMVGIEINEKVQPILAELLKEKLVALPAGMSVIRLLPPLVISKEELKKAAEILIKILK